MNLAESMNCAKTYFDVDEGVRLCIFYVGGAI